MSVQRIVEEPVRLHVVESSDRQTQLLGRVSEDRLYAVGLGTALLLGICLRLMLPTGTNFPLGDGGMFYQMVRDLLAHHLVPPAHTSYNHANIPFAYPLFGFYVIGLLHLLTGIGVLALMQWVPAVVCCLSLGAFALLARSLLASRLGQFAAVIAFALLPNSYLWEMKGGGITRAWGELFCLISLYFLSRLLRHGDRRSAIPAGIFVGLTIGSHLEWLWFLAYSILVFWTILARNRSYLRDLTLVGLVGAVVSAPWWLIEMHRWGPHAVLATFTGSAQAIPFSSFFGSILTLNFVSEQWFPLFSALGLLGLLFAIQRREWLLPVWLLAILVLNWRGPQDRAVVPVALLAGLGIAFLFEHRNIAANLTKRLTPVVALVAALVLLRTVMADVEYANATPSALSPSERDAMGWVAKHTSRSSAFAVVSGSYWALDDNGEWFPAITQRTSVATVQGTEWLPGVFARRYDSNVRLQECAAAGADCLSAWQNSTHSRIDYVYIANRPVPGLAAPGCCSALLLSLQHDHRYHQVYRQGTTAIFRRVASFSGR